jgi:hypothetical protein
MHFVLGPCIGKRTQLRLEKFRKSNESALSSLEIDPSVVFTDVAPREAPTVVLIVVSCETVAGH